MVEYIRKILSAYCFLGLVFSDMWVNQLSENTKIKPQICSMCSSLWNKYSYRSWVQVTKVIALSCPSWLVKSLPCVTVSTCSRISYLALFSSVLLESLWPQNSLTSESSPLIPQDQHVLGNHFWKCWLVSHFSLLKMLIFIKTIKMFFAQFGAVSKGRNAEKRRHSSHLSGWGGDWHMKWA